MAEEGTRGELQLSVNLQFRNFLHHPGTWSEMPDFSDTTFVGDIVLILIMKALEG